MSDNIKQSNRHYLGDIKNGFIYYEYIQKKKLKNGSIKEYKNIVKRKRNLTKLGFDNNKTKKIKNKGRGRPKRMTKDLYNLIKKLDNDKQNELIKHINNKYFNIN